MNSIFSIEQRLFLDHLVEPRTGWITRGVPENIAENTRAHTLKVVHATRLFATRRRGFDTYRAISVAVAHDFAEILTPDYMPGQVSLEEKHRQELAAIRYLTSKFDEAGKLILQDWLEFEAQETPISQIVLQFDKIDPAMQAIEYAKQGYSRMDEFLPYARKKICDEKLLWVFDEVVKRKDEQNAYKTYFDLLKKV